MKVILREVILLAGSIAVLAGLQSSVTTSFDAATQSAKATGKAAIKMRPLGSLIVPIAK